MASNHLTSFPKDDQNVTRRSDSYLPTMWDYDVVQSLTTNYVGEPYTGLANNLKVEVKMMLESQASKTSDQLELIDTLQRMGIAYHFQDEIKSILNRMFNDNDHLMDKDTKDDLYATALRFRLLRQHGYNVPQEIFNRFKDEQGKFRSCLCDDLKGMLYLYEASYLSVEGEAVLENARCFATQILKEHVKQCTRSDYVSKLVSHALEAPLHWRMLRMEASWFINAYESKQDKEPILLQLAKLDYNMVQAVYLEELKQSFRWWKNTGFGEKFHFIRNWFAICFLWAVGIIFEPPFGSCRRVLAKICELSVTIDDVYDVFGTVKELELFTDAIVRWDVNAMDPLPEYMKLCFLGFHNTINEMAYDILKDEGVHIIHHLKKVWADYSKAELLESKWYDSGYKPTLQEYLDNAYVTSGGPLLFVHAHCFATNPITTEALQSLEEYADLIRQSSLILRLVDDLGTSIGEQKRGDVPKAMECYTHDTGVSEEEAREHIGYLIREAWKKINGKRLSNPLISQAAVDVAMNVARMGHCMYGAGEEYGAALLNADAMVKSLVTPFPFASMEEI